MNAFLQQIIHQKTGDTVRQIQAIKGFGSVNQVYDVQGQKANYIVRINGPGYLLEYKKEQWCLEEIKKIGIPTAEVIAFGIEQDQCYMIQRKLKGKNGKTTSTSEQALIWKTLGQYAARFHQIKEIVQPEVQAAEFHDDWRARLSYNLQALNEQDALLQFKLFNSTDYKSMRSALQNLSSRTFKTGLVHGDLCPRNVLLDDETVHLIDWGTAEINIVPHNEFGVLILNQVADAAAQQQFLEGYGIAPEAFQNMEPDVRRINLLHQLDKFRWAQSYDQAELGDYAQRVRSAFDALIG